MSHICPECHATNVRRLSTPMAERTWRNTFFARYRCRDCVHEFWVIRRRAYAGAATLIAAIVLAIIAVVVIEQINNS
jgi:transposase-like protein